MLLDRKLPILYIIGKIKYDLILVTVVGLTTHYVTFYFMPFLPVMPLAIPAFLGTAISVLLSFKMNQSYDRWWEARKIWGSIVNDSRTFVIQMLEFLPENRKPLIQTMAYRQIAWSYSLGQSLRDLDPVKGLDSYFDSGDLKRLAENNNKPLQIVKMNAIDISGLRRAGEIDIWSHVQLDNTLTRLTDSMGRAERIKSTVFPSTYRLFLHFIIYIFVVTLSISLTNVKTYFELPLLLVISSCFFLVEKSAYHMQDPFRNRPSDTAMTAIARTIEINIRQLLGEQKTPAPQKPEKFYIM